MPSDDTHDFPVDQEPSIAPPAPHVSIASSATIVPPPSPSIRFQTKTPSEFAETPASSEPWMAAVGITQSTDSLDPFTSPKAKTITLSDNLVTKLHASTGIPKFLFDSTWPLSFRDSKIKGVKEALAELKAHPLPADKICDDDPDNVTEKWHLLCAAFELIRSYRVTEAVMGDQEVQFRAGIDLLYDIVFSLSGESPSELTYRREVDISIIKPLDPFSKVIRPSSECIADGVVLLHVPTIFDLKDSLRRELTFNKASKPARILSGALEYKLTDDAAAEMQLYFDLSAGSTVLHLLGVQEPIIGVTVTNKYHGARVYVGCWYLDEDARKINIHKSQITYPLNDFTQFLLFHSFLCRFRDDIAGRLLPPLKAVRVAELTPTSWKSTDSPTITRNRNPRKSPQQDSGLEPIPEDMADSDAFSDDSSCSSQLGTPSVSSPYLSSPAGIYGGFEQLEKHLDKSVTQEHHPLHHPVPVRAIGGNFNL